MQTDLWQFGYLCALVCAIALNLMFDRWLASLAWHAHRGARIFVVLGYQALISWEGVRRWLGRRNRPDLRR